MRRRKIRKLTSVAIAATLTALIAAAPAMAAGGKGRREREAPEASPGKVRVSHQDDAILFDYHHSATRARMQGYVDRTGAASLQGLTLKMLSRGSKGEEDSLRASISWAGQEIALPDTAAVQADPAVLEPVMALVSSWAKTVDLATLEGFRATMLDAAQEQEDEALLMQAACGWEIFMLAVDVAIAWVACGSGVLPACVFAFINLMDQLLETATACDWCGFGRPC